MSRLDDELKLALGRTEPSPDFADRVMRELARRNEPRLSMWRRVAEMFSAPRVRWAAAALACLLVLALGVGLFVRGRRVEPPQPQEAAVVPPAPPANTDSHDETGTEPKRVTPPPNRRPRRPSQMVARRSGGNPDALQVKSEGEAAKERLMLALRIASTTLNDAQRIVRGDTRSEP
jgi:hypothetical protein